jgi:DNA-directed RNA polymerase subunit D
MKVEVLHKTDSDIKFLVEGVKPSFVSALRRIMMTEVPTMAIEWVDFKKNDSALNDEIIANRLGQIPLTFDQKVYNLPEMCKCEGKGCSRCQVKLTLKKKGPCMVYSGDLKSTDKDVRPVYDKIPIVELFEGQDLQFEAVAQLGLGKTHAKWQGAVVGYKNKPDIKIDRDLKPKDEYVKSCPVNVLEIEGDKLIAARPMDCTLCMECVEASGERIKVRPVEDSFIINVETTCGLPAGDVVVTAAEILEDKMNEFGKALGKLK